MKIEELLDNLAEKKKYNEDVKVEIVCTDATAKESLVPLLNYIKSIGNPGHSFDIVVEPNLTVKEGKKTFGFDGDGPHRIDSIKIDGKEYRSNK